MSENKHTGNGRYGKGYYIALILCAAAIGITGYVYYQNTNQTEQVLLEESEYIPVGTMDEESDVPVLATQAKPEETQPESSEQPTVQVPAKRPLKTQSPVCGAAIYGYSMEALSYNSTTRDWRVHNGVDIAAEAGTPVCAAAEGTVFDVYEDDTLGYTVEIRHEGGYTTRYSSLRKDLAVSAGDTVTMGQTIGYADSTALVESTLGAHVHFSVTCLNQPMDPAEFLALGE